MISSRFEIPGLAAGVVADVRAGVRDGASDLLPDRVGRVEHQDCALRGARRRRHLLFGLLQVHDPATSLCEAAVRELERLPVAAVEALGDVACELQVLLLVVSDRDQIGLVEQDVSGHQYRVGEEASGDEVVLLRLLLELGHPAQLAVARDRAQQPSGLGVRGDMALDEDGRAVRVDSSCEQHCSEVERRVAQLVRVVGDRDRVQVDDAEEGFALLLRGRVLAEAARVVAELLRAGGLDAAEDAHCSRLQYRNYIS
jgi:hypothetical protein